ncbi:ABC transporter ATP-binding protein [Paenibacillus apiarius]|uniref:ABC transporter ATP-binding protein n=1 Tax=Paenibacillus apiarius TaxID=46240 RepID=A0ABT4DXZ0_9BACL|nr:ABC transporter ATP-binding protein [Paenibacillus apiarius]MCY9517507.1 ABC transporter ATP-binding protein [Paenibacillus apiarius]MCY9522214.1 ABC transporter ATP-binding protein [Paenibacillus apiarius]MCY9552248.1 ABC transporter ATP-binding protein [Paenibacillus apiarius]MCY9560127.1 ABC transporter ATP-binding protein [Paenibacillus apiarius]MCY9683745.1 ABC transporter ATP-binding protein [Paenibacillus apiarius]
MKHLLEVHHLNVAFRSRERELQAVRDVSFHVGEQETLAIVGESGSGKSVTARAIMGMLPSPYGTIKGGEIRFQGRDITRLKKRALRKLRGSEIGMVFQDPMSSLNPTMKVGTQIGEGLLQHQKLTRSEARHRTIELLQLVGIPDAASRYHQYPHEFSGGMRQRVSIAIALACNPKLLIADEPTTALDVTIQAQIMDMLTGLQERMGSSILLITHDLGVVAEVAHRVAVMYAGIIVETGTVEDIFDRPKHPYTWGLLQSTPKLDAPEQKRLIPIEGSPPDLYSPPQGCPFAQRCPYAMEVCVQHLPEAMSFTDNHSARCWLNDPRSPVEHTPIAARRYEYAGAHS